MSAVVDIDVLGVGLIGPGFQDWASARAVLRGEQPHVRQATVVPVPARLPAAERRRAGQATRIALGVADAACLHAGVDPVGLATVFASSSGDGVNCHALCESLAESDRLVSPTRFTNSVHNAPAGYWHIAVGAHEASTSLCAFDDSALAGLTEALVQVAAGGPHVMLVASDAPYPQPLQGVRPISDVIGVALVLAPVHDGAAPRGVARLRVRLAAPDQVPTPTSCTDTGLETLRQELPTARMLPLLSALAAEGPSDVVLQGNDPHGVCLHLSVTPCAEVR